MCSSKNFYPFVSIIIPCRNEVKHIQQCLEAVLSTDWPLSALEVLVVDGLSDDGTNMLLDKLAKQYSQIKILKNEKQLTPSAFNLGIEAAQGQYVFIVGSRQILAENYISTCVRILEQDPSIGCVGGRIVNCFENQKSQQIAFAMSSAFGVGFGNFRTQNQDVDVDTVPTPCYRKSIFQEVGLFDEALFRNQDDEFNYRVRRANYRIFQTSCTEALYYVRANYRQLWRQYQQYGYWKIYVNRKHQALTTLRQIIPALFVLYLFSLPLLIYFHSFFSILIFLYCLLAFIFAFKQSQSLTNIWGILKAFVLMHLAYGLGYLEGFWQLIVCKKKPQSKHSRLSR